MVCKHIPNDTIQLRGKEELVTEIETKSTDNDAQEGLSHLRAFHVIQNLFITN